MEKKKKKSSQGKIEVEGFEEPLPRELPVVPARDIVAFPSVMMSLYIDHESSVRAVEHAAENDRAVIVVAQEDLAADVPEPHQLYHLGVLCNVSKTLKLPDNRYKVLLQGVVRCEVKEFRPGSRFLSALYEPLPVSDDIELLAEHEVLINRIHEGLRILVENEHVAEEMLVVTEDIDDPSMLADVILAHYRLEIPLAQKALEELDPLKRLRLADEVVTDDLNQFLISENVREQAREEMTKDQRDYYLREQIKLIRRELGEEESQTEDLSELQDSLEAAKLPPAVAKEADRQMSRLRRMHTESSEYAMLRTYLEWISDLPWKVKTRERLDLKRAGKILDEDHYGLHKIKDRILEYLSVRKLNKDSQGPILCFVGPPGVGKTSLGKSI
ncbi:MAG: LON peptidase substrate-binding domain-containing protein, partial [Bdellovibrionales bacterium]|nr:LON peptidase substrate-binding domain-containing protein [Bdellovibrionales bacterium]